MKRRIEKGSENCDNFPWNLPKNLLLGLTFIPVILFLTFRRPNTTTKIIYLSSAGSLSLRNATIPPTLCRHLPFHGSPVSLLINSVLWALRPSLYIILLCIYLWVSFVSLEYAWPVSRKEITCPSTNVSIFWAIIPNSQNIIIITIIFINVHLAIDI